MKWWKEEEENRGEILKIGRRRVRPWRNCGGGGASDRIGRARGKCRGVGVRTPWNGKGCDE